MIHAMRTMHYVCDACGLGVDHDPNEGHVPPEWRFKRIQGHVYMLCGSCGHEGHFRNGLSPVLARDLRARGFHVKDE